MIEARFLRHLEGFRGSARLYQLSEAISYHDSYDDEGEPIETLTDYVIASAVVAYSGPEVLIFPADPSGEIDSYLEIYGQRGTLDHDEVIRGAGWTPIYELES